MAASGDECGMFDAVEGRNVFASYDAGKTQFEVAPFFPLCPVFVAHSLSLSQDEWHFAHIRALGGYYYRKWDGDFSVESEVARCPGLVRARVC